MADRKKQIISDLKSVAAKVGECPNRDEYLLHGKFSERQIRKYFNGSFVNLIAESGITPKGSLNVIDQAGLRIAQQNEEIKALRRDNQNLADQVLSAERIKRLIGCDGLDTKGEGADWLKGIKNTTRGKVNGVAEIILSDWHLDEVVQREQVRGYNEYNREIAEKRLAYTFVQSSNLLKNYLVNPKYDGIIANFGGDFLSGTIHDELNETNEVQINQSILHWSSRLVQGLGLLADEFGKVFVPCVVGNHGRHHKKPRAKNYVIDNYEWLMYHMIARELKSDSRISFLIPEAEDAFYEVYGSRHCLTHGNQFSGGFGVGGIMVPILRGVGKKQGREAALDQSFSLIKMGHWHQYLHMRGLVINGAGKGYDEYAFKNNFPFEQPTQAAWVNHRDRGVIFPMSIICNGYEPCRENKKSALSW